MPTRRSLLASLAQPLLVALFLAPACNTTKAEVDEVPRDLRGRWFLAELEGVDLGALEAAGVRRPELLIDIEGAVSGFGGVNRFGSSLDLEVLGVQRFVLSRITSTMMAGEPEAMELESRFLQALQDARDYALEGERLELWDLPEEEDDDEQGVLLVALTRRR